MIKIWLLSVLWLPVLILVWRRLRQLQIDAEAKDLLSELQHYKVNETVSDEFKARIRLHLDKAAY